MRNTLSSRFFQIFQNPPEIISSAPGRINLIGEHTDYNLGFVLPAAINKKVWFLASRRPDNEVNLWAENFNESCQFSLDNIEISQNYRWANYVKGILWVLKRQDFNISGINAFISGNVPLEAGLSSSAALEMSVIFGLNILFGLGISPFVLAEMGQRAESEFVGVKCGIMDQFISVFGKKNHAVFLDCKTHEFETLPLDLNGKGLGIVVYDSRVQRELADSAYNKRRSESSEALEGLKKLGIHNFRDASLDVLEKNRKLMDETLYKRAKHVISENKRVLATVDALRGKDYSLLGKLLLRSHESLRDDYEVSCDELDLLYESAKEFDGCWGARMIGAGFGGSGIALLNLTKKEAFKRMMLERAVSSGFRRPDFYDIEIGEGANGYEI